MKKETRHRNWLDIMEGRYVCLTKRWKKAIVEIVEWIIESPASFSKYVRDLYEIMQDNEGKFTLSDEDEIIDFQKYAELIIDPFLLDFHNRQIQKKLYAELQNLAVGSEFYLQTQELKSQIQKYFIDLEYASGYDLEIADEIDLPAIFKAVGIQLDGGNEETLFERIAIYIKIMAELLKKKLVILVNSRSYLTSDQIDQIAELCMYSEVGLLLIENVQRDFSKKRNYCIIDCDECCIS